VPRLTFSLRRAWNNHTGNQGIDPLRIYKPRSLDEVVEIVQKAEADGVTVRAVGSGHSWSDVQTVAGVISTSTHGSGIAYGPLSDIVLSMDVVGSGGTVYRIEPAHGPTDRADYEAAHPDRELKQDDQWFAATRVGMGCLGVIYSTMLSVVPSYWLKEVRTVVPWSEIKKQLSTGDVLRDNDHYELIFNPYPRGGDRRFLTTTRNRVERSPGIKPDRRRRRVVPELLSSRSASGRSWRRS